MLFAGVSTDETAIEVVDDVTRAPVHLGCDGAHVSSTKGGQQQSAKTNRQVVVHHLYIAKGRIRFARFRIWSGSVVQNERTKRDDDPWPRSQSIVRDVEPQRCEQSVLFVLG